MLNKEIIMDLLNNKRYTRIIDHFYVAYEHLLERFLNEHNIEIEEHDVLLNLTYKVSKNFPRYKGLMKSVEMLFNNEEMLTTEKIDKLIGNYVLVRNRLT